MKLDSMGVALSGACLLHCALVALAVVAAPSAGAWMGATENAVHWLLVVLAVGVSGLAFYSGFRRHGALSIVLLGGLGLSVMFVGAAHLFGRAAETFLTLSGAGIVAVAHLANLRRCAAHG
jgi:hypothetical protein